MQALVKMTASREAPQTGDKRSVAFNRPLLRLARVSGFYEPGITKTQPPGKPMNQSGLQRLVIFMTR